MDRPTSRPPNGPERPGSEERTRPPAVTVVVACYNHAPFVVECLDSIDAQTFRDFHVVFVDDCSTDDSRARAEARLATFDVPVTIVAHATNRGVCTTCNDGVRLAAGEYVAIVAADDRWYPGCLASHIERFRQADRSVGIVYADADLIDETGASLGVTLIDTQIGSRRPEGDLFFELLPDSFLVPSTTLVRRAVYRTVGLYDESLAIEDHDLYLRATRSFTFAHHAGPAGAHRVVASSLNRTLDWRRRLVTRSRTYGKLIGLPGGRGEAARRQQYEALAKLYLDSPAAARGEARRAALRAPSARLVGLAVLASLGVPYDVAKRIGRRVLSL